MDTFLNIIVTISEDFAFKIYLTFSQKRNYFDLRRQKLYKCIVKRLCVNFIAETHRNSLWLPYVQVILLHFIYFKKSFELIHKIRCFKMRVLFFLLAFSRACQNIAKGRRILNMQHKLSYITI